MEKLVADGVDRREVVAAFDDPRVPAFTGLEFSARRPTESKAMYRSFLRGPSISAARRCRLQHAAAFERAERMHGVSADVVAAILHVETHCGQNTGNSIVLYRLARLAMANEPENVRRNLARLTAEADEYDPDLDSKVRQRGRYLEDTFYPEVRAMFDLAHRLDVDPLDVRGSAAGAFGYPQFLPSSFLTYGADGDGDGRISLYDVDDAAVSCARYLHGFGWQDGLSDKAKRQVVWHYNHSEAYIDAVLGLAARMDGSPIETPRKTKPQHAKKSKTAKQPVQASAKQRRRSPG